jgi:hypothetical protein
MVDTASNRRESTLCRSPRSCRLLFPALNPGHDRDMIFGVGRGRGCG